jgi:hypothetical protein
MKLPTSTYDVTYQYSPAYGAGWNTHTNLDEGQADLLLRMLTELARNYRVRQNATGRVVDVAVAAERPLTLLHLFFKRISGRCGKDTDQ